MNMVSGCVCQDKPSPLILAHVFKTVFKLCYSVAIWQLSCFPTLSKHDCLRAVLTDKEKHQFFGNKWVLESRLWKWNIFEILFYLFIWDLFYQLTKPDFNEASSNYFHQMCNFLVNQAKSWLSLTRWALLERSLCLCSGWLELELQSSGFWVSQTTATVIHQLLSGHAGVAVAKQVRVLQRPEFPWYSECIKSYSTVEVGLIKWVNENILAGV